MHDRNAPKPGPKQPEVKKQRPDFIVGWDAPGEEAARAGRQTPIAQAGTPIMTHYFSCASVQNQPLEFFEAPTPGFRASR